MKIRILASGIADLERGKDFYERQGEGLGQYFMDSLFSDIDSLALYAGTHSTHWGYFRLLSKRFPYAVYYRIDNDVIQVWRVLDCRQHPRKIKRALH
ncbi:MAG TPA: type II toxin-antitoxin system RelE/ParE family toxin [Verrucomicrobiae bacterium]|nr:type II toxin-antitoxin system RelE/ParE family toxin [Verrucomicrobiae bacterium]